MNNTQILCYRTPLMCYNFLFCKNGNVMVYWSILSLTNDVFFPINCIHLNSMIIIHTQALKALWSLQGGQTAAHRSCHLPSHYLLHLSLDLCSNPVSMQTQSCHASSTSSPSGHPSLPLLFYFHYFSNMRICDQFFSQVLTYRLWRSFWTGNVYDFYDVDCLWKSMKRDFFKIT